MPEYILDGPTAARGNDDHHVGDSQIAAHAAVPSRGLHYSAARASVFMSVKRSIRLNTMARIVTTRRDLSSIMVIHRNGNAEWGAAGYPILGVYTPKLGSRGHITYVDTTISFSP